ncbi:hypothetical protein EDC04DRAFT_2604494 [Pisolithus marmoratus]|nr:hypothetical protein EDC04DRAFT_2604494 [Pisolithus marmoratus]
MATHGNALHLFIRTVPELLALHSTLRRYATESSGFAGTQSPGQWARRLDITWNFFDDFECEDPHSCIETLADVIKCLPKLEIVSFAMSGSFGSEPISMPLSVLDALRRSANSLCILDWSGDDLFPQLHQLEELLRDLPNLRVLRCSELVWADGIILSSILRSPLSLWRDWFRETATLVRGAYPRHVDGDDDLMQQFIIRYGKYLTTDLGLLHKSCPDISHLILFLDYLVLNGRYLIPRIEFLRVELGALSYYDLFRFLAYLRSEVPTLRVFQLLSPFNVQQLTCSFGVSVEDTMEKLNKNPFRVEDDEENPLSGGSTPAMNGSRASAPSRIFP